MGIHRYVADNLPTTVPCWRGMALISGLTALDMRTIDSHDTNKMAWGHILEHYHISVNY